MVIVSDPSVRGLDPAAVRLRNVRPHSFELRLQEPAYLDGTHVSENLSYVVMEAGNWILPDGTRFSAGSTNTNLLSSQGLASVDGITGFTTAPTVLTQTQTSNGADWVTTRVRGQTACGF